jgi:hypothetical protein
VNAGLAENRVKGGLATRNYTESEARGYRQGHWGWSREIDMVRHLRKGLRIKGDGDFLISAAVIEHGCSSAWSNAARRQD